MGKLVGKLVGRQPDRLMCKLDEASNGQYFFLTVSSFVRNDMGWPNRIKFYCLRLY